AGFLPSSRHDWAHVTTAQIGLAGRAMHWPRGKVLGGTSSINYMVYMRGHRANYDAWRDLGNEGWGYGDVLPLFKRGENNARGGDAFHRAGGELDVTDVPRSALSERFLEAAVDALGIAENRDFNGAE